MFCKKSPKNFPPRFFYIIYIVKIDFFIKGFYKKNCVFGREKYKKRLTWNVSYDILCERDKIQVFFLCSKNENERYEIKRIVIQVEVARCAQESHWHVRSANSVTTIQRRIRRLILTGWRRRSIADSAGNILCIRRRSNRSSFLKRRQLIWQIQQSQRNRQS